MTSQHEDYQRASFGTYLQSARKQKGLTLYVLSDITKISRTIIARIETEDHRRLPAPVYVKGFIRTYAKVVNTDAGVALSLYARSLANYRNSLAPVRPSHPMRWFWLRFGFAILLLAALIVGSIKWMSRDAGPQEGGEPSLEAVKPPAPASSEARVASPADNSGAPAPALYLEVTSRQAATLKAIIDGQPPVVYQLKPGAQLALEAENEFNLLLDNADGVSLSLNGKPVVLNAKNGQPVTLKLP
jgi:cytoskeleton protein RodZ